MACYLVKQSEVVEITKILPKCIDMVVVRDEDYQEALKLFQSAAANYGEGV